MLVAAVVRTCIISSHLEDVGPDIRLWSSAPPDVPVLCLPMRFSHSHETQTEGELWGTGKVCLGRRWISGISLRPSDWLGHTSNSRLVNDDTAQPGATIKIQGMFYRSLYNGSCHMKCCYLCLTTWERLSSSISCEEIGDIRTGYTTFRGHFLCGYV